jgi:hypothetical protein
VIKRARAARQWQRQLEWWVTKRARATKRAMALATRVECNKESDCFGSKRDGNEGGRQSMAIRAMATVTATAWAIVMEMRLEGNKEGKGEDSKGDGNGDEGGG